MNIRRKACMLTLLTFSNNPDCVNYNLENRNKVWAEKRDVQVLCRVM